MRIRKLMLTILSALAVAGLMSGCAQKPIQAKCGVPDFCKPTVRVKVKKVAVSECPKEVKTVIYKSVCKDCNNYPVSVRKNNCCTQGGCK